MPQVTLDSEIGQRHSKSRGSIGFAIGVPLTVILLLVVGTTTSPEFLTVRNLLNVLTSISIVGIVAVGMSFVMISGGWADLSVPAVVATGAILALGMQSTFGTIGAILIALVACATAGLINGLIVGFIKVNPIVVTLGTNIIVLGAAQAFVGGDIVYNNDPIANAIVAGRVFGIPFIALVFLVVLLFAHIVLAHTVWGRWTIAAGGNYAAAAASGVPVKLVRCLAFVGTALAAGLSGCLLALSLQSARPVIGAGYEFDAITALVVGGVSLLGGAGSIPRVLGGLLIVQLIKNIMVLQGFPTTSQGLAEGLVIVFAVALDIKLRKRSGDL
ncbi:ABC transporter permease [Salinibacterium sp. TMP30]|uniref:ABC transporter permease n=1 Tax=Salinibacterium sp. TMP30 TaxID=3138237 RepID=UPI0031389952